MEGDSLEQWLPLFQIFLNSTTPENDAALWLQNHRLRRQHPTTSFLSLLLFDASSPHSLPTIFLQTLPPILQSRIISFLTVHHHLFSRALLRSLAAKVLDSSVPAAGPAFWARRAAHHLLDAVSSSAPSSFPHARGHCHHNDNENEDDFFSLPQWIKDPAFAAAPLLPWLPLSPDSLPKSADWSFSPEPQSAEIVTDRRDARQNSQHLAQCSSAPTPSVLGPQVIKRAFVLKAEILATEATPEAIRLANEIRQLCLNSGDGNQFMILGLIEPWEADDEMTSALLSYLSGEHSLKIPEWHAHVLGSVVLPKLLTLHKPASRVLLSATLQFSKQHPVASVDALFLPLALRKEGINVALSDVLARVVKECLHPVHVSAACQRLLCRNIMDRKPICLPCHQEFISDEVVWTESMFVLFQHILNHNVYLTPDTVEKLVFVIDGMANKFSKSLKFGNFMLCFVSKCARALNAHRSILEQATLRTETFVTKSVLSKLSVNSD